MLKAYGPAGCMIDGYVDLSKCLLWEWNESLLGPMYIDSDRTFFYDGQSFMQRTDGHPDDATTKETCVSLSLELWLVEQADRRDPELTKDKKFYYRNLWHEFLRVTKVSKIFKIHRYFGKNILMHH